MPKMKETVYYYQPKPDKNATAKKAVMLRLGVRIRMLEAEQLKEQVGFVAGLPGFVSQETLKAGAGTAEPEAGSAAGTETAEPEAGSAAGTGTAASETEGAADSDQAVYTEEMMLFQGFSNSRLDQLLKQFHRAKLPKTNLKAILTAQNVNWTFAELYRELLEEHARMHAEEATAVEAVEAVKAKEAAAVNNMTEKEQQ